MSDEPSIQTICVVGGGSAGCLAAVTLRRLLPGRRVIAVRSPSKPVIGVGESTTAFLPLFLHRHLGLSFQRFYQEVQPSWKLGIRFVWGPPEIDHFNYPFGFELSRRSDPLRKRAAYYCLQQGGYAGSMSALMDHDRSPCLKDDNGSHYLLDQPFGYHIDNKKFLAYLDRVAHELGVEFVAGDVVSVSQSESGHIESLMLADGNRIAADLFIDCSGFESMLLGQTMGERYVSYSDALLCDSAIVGAYQRNDVIRPYTTAETMDHGWCWNIELPDHVTIGYVFSSSFCTPEQATEELRNNKPQVGDDLRQIRFPSGRYENYWCKNVVAIGNASGFVEPLESTALHVIAEQLIAVCGALLDADYRIEPAAREIENIKFRRSWDSIRDFLAVHYRFNRRRSTPFWRHCHEQIDIGGALPLVDAYQRLGPNQACESLLNTSTLVQYEGYLAMLIGQRVETECNSLFDDQDLRDWDQYQSGIADKVARAVPVREALMRVSSPQWNWS